MNESDYEDNGYYLGRNNYTDNNIVYGVNSNGNLKIPDASEKYREEKRTRLEKNRERFERMNNFALTLKRAS